LAKGSRDCSTRLAHSSAFSRYHWVRITIGAPNVKPHVLGAPPYTEALCALDKMDTSVVRLASLCPHQRRRFRLHVISRHQTVVSA
jgi:hypothetical protein